MGMGRQFALRVIRAAMDKTGLAATPLAQRAGVNQTTLTRFINNPSAKSVPGMATLEKVAQAANASIDELAALPAVANHSINGATKFLATRKAPGAELLPSGDKAETKLSGIKQKRPHESDLYRGEAETECEMSALQELDVRAAAGFSGVDPSELQTTLPVSATWMVPKRWLQEIAPGPAPHLKILRVIGDSMLPDFQPNQRVMVDVNDTVPSPEGVFILWDGLSVIMKRVHYVPHSDPPRVIISSINPVYPTYERLLGEAYIQARVVGRWQPT